MTAPFAYYQERYNGSNIIISIEKDGDDPGSHIVTSIVNDAEVDSQTATSEASLTSRGVVQVAQDMLQAARNNVDGIDALDSLISNHGFSEGSDPVINYAVTGSGSSGGSFVHSVNADLDLNDYEIQQAVDTDFNAAITVYAGTDPAITMTSQGRGVKRMFRIHGRRTDEPWGPWSYAEATTL